MLDRQRGGIAKSAKDATKAVCRPPGDRLVRSSGWRLQASAPRSGECLSVAGRAERQWAPRIYLTENQDR